MFLIGQAQADLLPPPCSGELVDGANCRHTGKVLVALPVHTGEAFRTISTKAL